MSEETRQNVRGEACSCIAAAISSFLTTVTTPHHQRLSMFKQTVISASLAKDGCADLYDPATSFVMHCQQLFWLAQPILREDPTGLG